MNRQTLTSILIITMLTGVISACNARPVKLEYKFKAGQTDRYKVNIRSKNTIDEYPSTGNKPAPTVVKTQVQLTQKTIKVNRSGQATLQISIKMTGGNIPGGGSLPGTTRIISVGKSGNSTQSAGPKSNTVRQGTSGISVGDTEGVLITLPQKRVSMGDTWTDTLKMPGESGIISVKSTYNGLVKSPKGKTGHQIIQSYSGILDMSRLASVTGQSGPLSKSKLTVTGKSTYILDRKDCRVLSATGIITSSSVITSTQGQKTKGAKNKQSSLKVVSIQETQVTKF